MISRLIQPAGRAGTAVNQALDGADVLHLILIVGLVSLVTLSACGGAGSTGSASLETVDGCAAACLHGDEHEGAEENHEGEESPHAHSHGEGGSDLDRSVSELLAERCEHDMEAYRCAECRYEVGIARADDRLFDASRGGVLETQVVGIGSAVQLRQVPGEVVLDGNRSVTVTPLAEGIVSSVAVDLGEKVRAGQILLELECPAFREAAAELDRATTEEAAAAAEVEREEELFARRVCPEKDLLAARADLAAVRSLRRSAEARLLALGLSSREIDRLSPGADPGLLPVRAPIDGEIVERAASRGSRVSPGEALLLVADTSRVWVMAELYESDLAAVVAASRDVAVEAEVVVGVWPDKVFRGQVQRLAGALDQTTRTARARVVVDNDDGLLRAGMFATVSLMLPADGATIMVPREAVLEDEGRSFAFVHVDGPYWVRRPVSLGASVGERIEVAAGLDQGDRIVTTGAFLLKSDVLRSKMGAGCAD